jgi:hypothetical protein
MARRKKNDEEPPIENQDNLNNDSDDTFGLPEVEYEPLKRDVTDPPVESVPPPPVEEPVADVVEEPVYEKPFETTEEVVENTHHEDTTLRQEETHNEYATSYHYMEPERPSPWPKILLITLLVLLVGGGLYWYFGSYRPEQLRKEAIEREAIEKAAANRERKRKEGELAEQRRREAEQRRADSLANVSKVGVLEVLTERTGQYYIVVASAIDDDLLTDYANKLVAEGKSVKLIPPFGKKGKFYRLAIDGKDNYADAQATADGMKGGDFGDQLWVVRY